MLTVPAVFHAVILSVVEGSTQHWPYGGLLTYACLRLFSPVGRLYGFPRAKRGFMVYIAPIGGETEGVHFSSEARLACFFGRQAGCMVLLNAKRYIGNISPTLSITSRHPKRCRRIYPAIAVCTPIATTAIPAPESTSRHSDQICFHSATADRSFDFAQDDW